MNDEIATASAAIRNATLVHEATPIGRYPSRFVLPARTSRCAVSCRVLAGLLSGRPARYAEILPELLMALFSDEGARRGEVADEWEAVAFAFARWLLRWN